MVQEHINQKFCVEIRVPTTKKHEGKTVFEFSSGYAIGNSLILTCEHGLFPENRDEAESLTITWRDLKGKSMDPKNVTREKICWKSTEFDIALIECKYPIYEETIKNHHLISIIKVGHNDSWCARGFQGHKQDIEKQKDFLTPEGSVSQGADESGFFKASVQTHGVDTEDEWGGFSGSPVFIEDKIVGVVKASNGKDSLTIMSIKAAMDVVGDDSTKTLREALNWPEQDPREVRQKSQFESMVKAIDNNEEVKAILRNLLNLSLTDGTEFLVKQFNQLDDKIAIAYLSDAFKTLKIQEKVDAVIAIGVFAECWSPVRLDLGLDEIEQLRKDIADPLKATVDMPNFIKMVDEIIMSELDNGPLAFCLDGEDTLSSKYNLGNFAETGLDDDGGQLSKEMDKLLKINFARINTEKGFEDKLDRHAYQVAKNNDGLGILENEGEIDRDAVGRILSNLFTLYGRRYFCRVNKQLDHSVYIDKKKIYQTLVFLTHNNTNASKDDDRYGLLSMIIAHAKKLKETR